MAKPQFPIDGKQGKAWKITSPYGWRIHPVEGTKKHHNGVDIWSSGTAYIESAYDGKVIFAGPSKMRNKDGSVGGFGFHVQVLSRENGMWIVNNYAHMVEGSIKVKPGQKIEAGTVLGIMGDTGMVTGKHLHWETCIGKVYKWTGDGKGYLDPIKFLKAVIARHEAIAEGSVATPDTGSVAPAPIHA